MAEDHVFQEMAVLLAIAAVIGAFAMRLRQPLIVAFIAVGILVGPSVLGIFTAEDEVGLLAELGISLLLFVVGLKLDVRLIRTTGPVALATGIGQIVFTSVIGFGIALGLGLDAVTALYVAVALTFSSTIIIVKLLSDKRETEELHGRIAIGFLIVQDIVVVIVMIVLTAFGAGDGNDVFAEVSLVLLKGVALVAALALLMRYALTPVLHRLARSPELMVLAAIAWGIGLAGVGDFLGFSQEVGAFLAGVALASTPYREAIAGRLVALRDFLLLFFFLDLGAGLDLGGLGSQIGIAVLLSLFVLIGNPLIVMAIIGTMGYRKRVGFLAGLTVSQISEFSLILAALGLGLGHIDDQAVALITAVGLITISVSTYAILYSHRLYELMEPWLGVFERRLEKFTGEEDDAPQEPVDIVVCGVGRYGARLAEALVAAGQRVMAVDFDPRAIEAWREAGRPAIYGDTEDPELPDALPLEEASWILSTVPRRDAGLALLHSLRHHGYRGKVALTVHHDSDAEELLERGADLVLSPFAYAVQDTLRALGLEDPPAPGGPAAPA